MERNRFVSEQITGRALRAAAGLGTESGQWGISKGRTTRDSGASAELKALVAISDPAL